MICDQQPVEIKKYLFNIKFIIRPHRYAQHKMGLLLKKFYGQPTCDGLVGPAIIGEPIDMAFGVWTVVASFQTAC